MWDQKYTGGINSTEDTAEAKINEFKDRNRNYPKWNTERRRIFNISRTSVSCGTTSNSSIDVYQSFKDKKQEKGQEKCL